MSGAIASSRIRGRPFPGSFWRRRLRTKTPHANSAGYVAYILANLADPNSLAIPWIATTGNTHPFYIVPESQPTVTMTLRTSHPDMQPYFNAVPIPETAKPSGAGPPQIGTDLHMSVWQPSREKYWEFWSTFHNLPSHPTYPGWNCGMGGYMGPDFWKGASQWAGYFPTTADGFGGGAGGKWGATGSGLASLGLVMRASELERGEILHALGAALGEFSGGAFVDNGTRAGKVATPAPKCDGASTDVNAPPEGLCFTLPDAFDPDTLNYRQARIMAKAIRDFGFYIHDGVGAAIQFYAEGVESVGYNPYTGASGFFEGASASTVLADFPFDQLIALDTTISNYP